jgi:L-ascorbate metabolism protein UlaG (beta-lactamase superfamily)
VLRFSNGLVVYLSGDTGVTAEQDTVVRDQYGTRLAVINIGDTFTTGPTETAFVVNELIKPKSVIASHVDEGATLGGTEIPGTRTARFIAATRAPVHVPLSRRTMLLNSKGRCVGGC